MVKFFKRYKDKKKKEVHSNEVSKTEVMNREGYGYIKRRMGLLSNEVGKPTYYSLNDNSEK